MAEARDHSRPRSVPTHAPARDALPSSLADWHRMTLGERLAALGGAVFVLLLFVAAAYWGDVL